MTHKVQTCALGAILVWLAGPMTADSAGYVFDLPIGKGLPVCEVLLKAAQEALPEVVGRCELPEPNKPDHPPGIFIDWRVLRNHMGPEIRVPEWRELNLSDPKDFEEAMFSLAASDAIAVDMASVTEGISWDSLYTDDKILRLTREYLRRGSLPHEVLPSPDNLQILPQYRFFASDFAYNGASDRLIRRDHLAYDWKPICYVAIPVGTRIMTLFQHPNNRENGGAESHGVDDVMVFRNELYGVRYRQGGNYIALTKYSLAERYNGFDVNMCLIEAHTNGDKE